jgi:hypothetical protein
MIKTLKQIRENHIGLLQTIDHKISHLPSDKQRQARQHYSLAQAATLRSNVKEAEKHFKHFRSLVGEEVQQEGWVQGAPKPGESLGKPVKLNNGDMGKITHELGDQVVVTTRDGWKRQKRSDIATHHVAEEVVAEAKKFLGKYRGKTATGQKANVIDTDPKLRFSVMRKQNRGL